MSAHQYICSEVSPTSLCATGLPLTLCSLVHDSWASTCLVSMTSVMAKVQSMVSAPILGCNQSPSLTTDFSRLLRECQVYEFRNKIKGLCRNEKIPTSVQPELPLTNYKNVRQSVLFIFFPVLRMNAHAHLMNALTPLRWVERCTQRHTHTP